MWILALLVVSVLATGIVFAVNESLRQAGLRGFAGAAGAPPSYSSSGTSGYEGLIHVGRCEGCDRFGRPVSGICLCIVEVHLARFGETDRITKLGDRLSDWNGLLRNQLLDLGDLLSTVRFALDDLPASLGAARYLSARNAWL